MKKMKINMILLSLMFLLVSACYEDKGNYTYEEVAVITVDNLPDVVTAVQKTDEIVLEPVITSSVEGVINDDNPNYEFNCRLVMASGVFENNQRYIDINPEKKKDIHFLADINEGSYSCWYMVTDKRSGVTSNFEVPVRITSATYEGWMVLCDEGANNKVRLDFVSILSKDRIETIHDILGQNAPQLTGAKRIYFDPKPHYASGDDIWLSTAQGTYVMDYTTLQIEEMDNLKIVNFIVPPTDNIIAANGLSTGHFAFSENGNAYFQGTSAGAAFEFPINTTVYNTNPQFRVAPFVGTIQQRPSMYGGFQALFYDIDNKRFLRWYRYTNSGAVMIALTDPAPESALFSYTTGKDMVAMVSTKFAEARVYSILQDEMKRRYIYGINFSGYNSVLQSYYSEITSTGFGNATQFAFHSQYPYMFYNGSKNEVYCYHLMNHSVTQPLTLDGEEITLLKFNLFQTNPSSLSDSSDEFLEQQYYLIVGSYKENSTDDNGGILRFYRFDQSTGTLTKVLEYTGFAKIRDVVYRERYN